MSKHAVTVIGLSAVLAVGTAVPAEAATPVGTWHMEDTGSVMNDSTSNNLDGSLTNVDTGVDGAVGDAFGFSESHAYVTVPNSTKLNPVTSTFTVSIRVKFPDRPSSSVGDYDLVRKGLSSSSGGNWKLEILQNGYAFCQFEGSSGKVTVSRGPDLSNDQWHTISCQRSSSGVRLTVDGSSSTKTGTTGSISNSSTMIVGAKNSSGDDQYEGDLDEMLITRG